MLGVAKRSCVPVETSTWRMTREIERRRRRQARSTECGCRPRRGALRVCTCRLLALGVVRRREHLHLLIRIHPLDDVWLLPSVPAPPLSLRTSPCHLFALPSTIHSSQPTQPHKLHPPLRFLLAHPRPHELLKRPALPLRRVSRLLCGLQIDFEYHHRSPPLHRLPRRYSRLAYPAPIVASIALAPVRTAQS
jgi:hypothetical protein